MMRKLAWLPLLMFALAAPAGARDMKLTIYDDGLSCPGNCDAHVVMNPQDNGTRFAFRPGSSRSQPQECLLGEQCTICFGEANNSCMTALYRGGGPRAGTFDFTPAFYDANCPRPDIPAALRRQCTSLDNAVTNLGYQNRKNCFADPTHAKCVNVLQAALAAQEADRPKRALCVSLGEEAYNSQQTDPRERRIHDCNYQLLKLGGTPARPWHILLPGACRSGTYVGRDGLDCCSRNVRFAASVHPECTPFYRQ